MSVRKVGDFPTRRLDATVVQRYARDADAYARLGIQPDPRSTSNLVGNAASASKPPEVSVDSEPDSGPIATPPPGAQRESDIRLSQKALALDAVPVVVMSAEDLSWFVLDEARPVLECIDGRATVAEILRAVTMPAADALLVLRELEEHRVIELSRPP